MGFSNPLTLAQIQASVPTAAQNAAATDAATHSVSADSQATSANTFASTARIRSMTRTQYSLTGAGTGSGPYTWGVGISLTNASRAQVALQGFYIASVGASSGDYALNQPSLYSISTSTLTLVRATNSFTINGLFEIMEWV